jgi:F-type H+-transporting ATPase subunit epsilon
LYASREIAVALHLEIVTPKGSVLATDTTEVVLPGRVGEFAVLEGHIPLLAALKPGVVRYDAGGKPQRLAVGSGFAEVGAGDRVVALVDDHAFPGKVDADAVREELRAAEEALKGWAGEIEALDQEADEWKEVPEHVALLERIAWAQARLDLTK